MTVGMCSCEVGKDGSPCKHQYVLWCSNIAHCLNFVPVAQPDVRQKLAWIAIGESLPLSHYQPLRAEASQVIQGSDYFTMPVSTDVHTLQPEDCTATETPDEVVSEDSGDNSQDTFIASATDMLRKCCDQIADKLKSTRDQNLAKGIVKFSKRVMTLTTSQAMHSDLTAALFDFGTSGTRKSGKGKKIRVQPNRKRKYGNGSRQAVSKGRPIQLQEELPVPSRKAKRTHDLAKAVQANTQNSKKSGAQTMKSKTQHTQRKRQK